MEENVKYVTEDGFNSVGGKTMVYYVDVNDKLENIDTYNCYRAWTFSWDSMYTKDRANSSNETVCRFFFIKNNAIAYIKGNWDVANHCIKGQEVVKKVTKQTDLFDSYTIEEIENAAIKIVGEDEVRDIIEELRKTNKDYKPKDTKKSLYNNQLEFDENGVCKFLKCVKSYAGNQGQSVSNTMYDTSIRPNFSSNSWFKVITNNAHDWKNCFIPITEHEYMMQQEQLKMSKNEV